MARKRRKNSMRGYFREQFEQHPDWLDLADNSNIINQWIADHGGKEMPPKVKKSMATCKSSLRHAARSASGSGSGNGRKKGGRKKTLAVASAAPRSAVAGLEHLDEMIGTCLDTARGLYVVGIEPVLKHLRVAQAHIVLLFDDKK